MNRGTMGVNSLPKTVTRQRRGCDLNLGHSAPESKTLATQLPSQQSLQGQKFRGKGRFTSIFYLAGIYIGKKHLTFSLTETTVWA